jgi:hypothetical protein
MKFSTFFLLFAFCLLAFAQAAPPADNKLKPKPKPKPKHHPVSPTASPTVVVVDDDAVILADAPLDETSSSSGFPGVESVGLVAVLCGVAIACVGAIVSVIRTPDVEHEPLPVTSERAVDTFL